jgi:putative oxidoreductase
MIREVAMTTTKDWAATILRLAVGAIFLAHGAQKLFVFHFSGVSNMFSHIGIPLPHLSAVVVTLVEFFGGLALILGFGTRVAALLLAIDMVGAIGLVHFKNGFFAPRGFEYPFVLLAANIGLMLTGAGALALDNWLGRGKKEDAVAKAKRAA